MPIKRSLGIVFIVLALCGQAWAGPLEDGVAAYNRFDYATAIGLLRPLAEQGDAKAQVFLGAMYQAGNGAPQDYAEAARWFGKAADQGEASAQINLGGMYEFGQGVPQDFSEAARWYRMAADQGYFYAQDFLGDLYSEGRGVLQDYVQAHMWFNLAAARIPAAQSAYRSLVVEKRDRLAAKMTPAQIAEAQKLAREWKPTVNSFDRINDAR